MQEEQKMIRRRAITLLGVLSGAITLYFVFLRFDVVSGVLSTIVNALQPIIVGIALAFVLRPAAKKLEKLLEKSKIKSFARTVSVVLTMVAVLGLVWLFCAIVFPQLIETVSGLISVLPGQLSSLLERVEAYLKTNEEVAANVNEIVNSAQIYVSDWIQNHLLGSITALISNVVGLASAVVNLLIAVIVALYLLLGWERYVAQCKKLYLSIGASERVNNAVFETMAQVNTIFNGFIVGKLLDSLIVGIICFAAMTLLRMPYTVLISVIVGVTNVIPMFGPFIGAIPSALLILLISPAQCLVFVLFILILQQIDGNIIGPRILGDSTGLSALYVTIAILLFGKLFGFIGMIIGVPLFATLYAIVKRFAESRLRKRNLPVKTEDYITKNK